MKELNVLKNKHIVLAFSEERKLLDDERVLFVQLNWGKDVREGRFLLRKEVSAELYNIVPPERMSIWNYMFKKFALLDMNNESCWYSTIRSLSRPTPLVPISVSFTRDRNIAYHVAIQWPYILDSKRNFQYPFNTRNPYQILPKMIWKCSNGLMLSFPTILFVITQLIIMFC